MILALVPLTAWSGMPHVACRCSNGEVHLFCPRLNESSAKTEQAVTGPESGCQSAGQTDHKSCCASTAGGTRCGSQVNGSGEQGESCCAAGCRCTAVCLASEISSTVKKISSPEPTQFHWVSVPMAVSDRSRVTHVDLGSIDAAPRVPDDLIVLCERWLI